MTQLTAAQKSLLSDLQDGHEVTFQDEHYQTMKDGSIQARIWPSTFYGLYDNDLVIKTPTGTYTISELGRFENDKG